MAKFILKKSAENGQKGSLEITHEKIAAELGTAREVISRILKDFEKENIVTLLRGKIIIKNEEKLKRIAEM
ncbi:Crp-like helix-turn-helix domain-containing protein [Thermoanaerobacter thermohydrosulfuricus]|nr:Crp-like helix-turn-helix domain-containing protein [Thermoanaerobacter thermohydrosulfuricus]